MNNLFSRNSNQAELRTDAEQYALQKFITKKVQDKDD